MSAWQLVALALVQGLTEFLPVSSSAHLVLLPQLLELPDQGLRFDVAANTGTLLAVTLYFHRDILRLAAAFFSRRPDPGSRRLLFQVVVATLPAVVAGLVFHDLIAGAARNPLVIATTSIVFGLALGAADRWGRRDRKLEQAGMPTAATIGLAQALALIPGTSRSGVTLTAGLGCGLERRDAARFSFLLAIPVSLGAAVLEAAQLREAAPGEPWQLVLVLVISAASGFAVIHYFLRFIERHPLWPFVAYRVALGLLLLVLFL